jgi:hypothetical protein
MLKVAGGRWPRNVLIPRAAGEDMFTSRLARELNIFPYGRNVAAIVSAVMEKDRQDASWKRRAFTRVGDPSREVKKARGVAKSAALGSCKPPPAAKSTARGPSKPSPGAKSIAPGSSKPLPATPMQERGPPSPPRTAEAVAGGVEVSMDVCVDDYLVGGVMMFDARTGRGLVGKFFYYRVWVFDKIMMQGRKLDNWLLFWRQWRLGRSRRRPRRRVLRRTHGPSFAPVARLLQPPSLRTWRARLRGH